MLRVTIVRSAQGWEWLGRAWEALYRAGRYSIFQSPHWNLLAARVFAGRSEPVIVHAESDSGAAIVPACITESGVSFLGDALFDYRDVLAEGDHEVLRRAWHEVAVSNRPLSLTALAGEESRREWHELGFAPAPFCHAPAARRAEISADEFAARHQRAAKAARRLAQAGVQFAVHSGKEIPLVRHIYEAKARQAIPGNLFVDPVRVEYMIAAASMDSGCEIFTLETAGTLVAALLTFRDGEVRRYYTTYYEPAWAHYSPGNVVLFEVTRRSLQEGLDCDLMTGEQPHKSRFATSGVPLFRVEATAAELARIAHTGPELESGRAPLPKAA